MKLKHNKKRNTAFLYEALIRQLTKFIIEKREEEREQLIFIIKEHFNDKTLLSRELKLYNALNDTDGLDLNTAEKLIFEVRKEHSNIDKQELFLEQTKLINKVNKAFSKSIFTNFVPNYKDLATIYQIFNYNSIKKRVLLERNILSKLVDKKENNEQHMKPIDNLVYKSFIDRFNNKYGTNLLKEQKELLNNYISSFVDNGVELKVFLNEELERLKLSINNSLTLEEIKNDPEMLNKTKSVLKIIESFREHKINKALISKVFKIQNLVKEIQS